MSCAQPKSDKYSAGTNTFSIPLNNVLSKSNFPSDLLVPYLLNLYLATVLENLTRELRDTRTTVTQQLLLFEAFAFMLPRAVTHSSCTTVAIETNHSVLPSNPSAFQLGPEILSKPSKSSSPLPGGRRASFQREHNIPLLKIKTMNNFPITSRAVAGDRLILAITNY